MKVPLIVLSVSILLLTNVSHSQSFYSHSTSVRKFNSALGGASPNSVWFGGQVSYRIGSAQDLGDNVLPTARGYWEITTFDVFKKPFVLPTIFNVGLLKGISEDVEDIEESTEINLQEVAYSSQGITFGINPYLELLTPSNSSVGLTLNCLLSAKINAFELDSLSSNPGETEYLLQGRFGLGFDFVIGTDYPLTISFSPILSVFDQESYMEIFHESKSSIVTYDASAILPINSGVGVLLDTSFGQDPGFTWKLGIIFAQQQ
jgi:hypothetical protein